MSRVALKAPAPAARVAPAARPARGNRPSATAAPAAPIVTTDPATVVAWARLGPRAPLPRRADAEAVIGAPLDGLEVLLGERAQRACALLGARAFAVGNVIGFAERTPTLSQIVHEAAHVVQQRRAGVLHAPPSAPGSFAIAAPGERAEREAAAIAGGGARPRLSAAPLRLYRDPVDVDTKEDKLDKVFQKRVLAFMRSAKWHLKAEELTGTDEALGDRRAVVGRRDGDSFKLWWKESSPDVFKASDYRAALAVVGMTIDESVASSDLAAARADATITQTGYIVDSKPTRLAVVGELDETGEPDTRAYYHALIGKSSTGNLDYFDRIQEVAAKGAAKSNPLTILDDLAAMVAKLRTAATGAVPKKQPLPVAPFDEILADVASAKGGATGATRASLFLKASKVREKLVKEIVDAYLGDTDELHDQVIATNVFVHPYQKVKGTIFEQFVAKKFPGLKIDPTIQPVFGDLLEEASFVKSQFLLKVRKGDGVALTTATDKIIIEAKAYTAGPGEEEVLQMRDYAKIIALKIPGYLQKKTGGAPEPVAQRFTKVKYFFTKADIAGKWIAKLDENLPGVYLIEPDLNAPASAEDTLKAYKASLAELVKLAKARKVTLTGVAEVVTKIDEALAKTGRPADEVAKDVATIRPLMIDAIATSYGADIDGLYADVLPGKVLFAAPHLAVTGDIFERWIAINRPGWPAASLANPLGGQVGAVRPIFGAKVKASTTYAGGAVDLAVQDDAIVFDRTGQAVAEPTVAEEAVLKDAAALIAGKIAGYLQAKAGTTNRAVVRTFTKAHFVFDNVDAAKPWQAFIATLGIPYAIRPDPKAPKSVITTVKVNPSFDFVIKDADQLEHTFAKDAIKQHPGMVFEELKLKLRAQRGPEIESGSMKLSIKSNSVVSQDAPVTKPITPAPAAPTQPGAKAKAHHGVLENKVGGLKSGLDNFLKRVRTDAKLVDNPPGIEASIRVSAGPSGLPKIKLEDAVIAVTVGTSGVPTVKGSVALAHESGKIRGSLTITASKGVLAIAGTVMVRDLVDGLAPVEARVDYVAATDTKPESLKFTIVEAKFDKTMKGVHLTGTAKNLVYDATAEAFSGTGQLEADLGKLGKASAAVEIAANAIKKVDLTYTTPTLAVPTKDPVVTGTVSGTFSYGEGKFYGSITGKAKIVAKALKRLRKDVESVELEVKVAIAADGTVSGHIQTLSDIPLGSHFTIPAPFKIAFTPTGSASVDFAIKVGGFKYLDGATIACRIDDTGFSVVSADIRLEIKKEPGRNYWGWIEAKYAKATGFVIGVDVNLQVKDKLVVNGRLTYDFDKEVLSGSFTTDPISVLKVPTKKYQLLSITKQIELVSFYKIIGIYFDFGIDLTFELAFGVTVKPTLAFSGLKLATFDFEKIIGTMQVLGELTSSLKLTPKIGLGLFVVSAKLLRGGGGIKIPISADAKVKADTTVGVVYKKDGSLEAGAQVNLIVTFGISGKVVPYAEFSVLNGAYEPKWEGDALTSFVIMPERELFRYGVNFGAPLTENTTPKLGGGPAKPAVAGDQRSVAPAAEPTAVTADKNAEPPPKPDKLEAAGEQDGFSIASLKDKLKTLPVYQKIDALLTAAAEVWEAISGFFGKVVNFFKKWFKGAIESVTDFLRQIKREGSIVGVAKKYLRALMGPILYDVIEPLLDVLRGFETLILDLVDRDLPEPSELFGWSFGLIKTAIGGAWSSFDTIVSALTSVPKRAYAALGKYLDYLIGQGRIGVRHSVYDFLVTDRKVADTYKIRLPGGISFSADPPEGSFVGNRGTAVAEPLKLALKLLGATPTNSRGDYWAD